MKPVSATSEQERHRRDWEDLGKLDPLWAILSDPAKKNNRWDLEAFLESGQAEIDAVMSKADALGYPRQHRSALDFGCGVGRTTRALAGHFDQCLGLDIAQAMVERARSLNGDIKNCRFEQASFDDLVATPNASFDFIYCSIVLQHIADPDAIEQHLRQLVGKLARDGLLVVQLPSWLPARRRMQVRRRSYRMLRSAGVSGEVLQRLRLHPISMTAIPEPEVTRLLSSMGATVLDVARATEVGTGIESRTYWVTMPGAEVGERAAA
jgi:trans-aconitate methyltransferase